MASDAATAANRMDDALRAVADTAVYSTSRREVSRRTEDLQGALGLAAAIVEARLAA